MLWPNKIKHFFSKRVLCLHCVRSFRMAVKWFSMYPFMSVDIVIFYKFLNIFDPEVMLSFDLEVVYPKLHYCLLSLNFL